MNDMNVQAVWRLGRRLLRGVYMEPQKVKDVERRINYQNSTKSSNLGLTDGTRSVQNDAARLRGTSICQNWSTLCPSLDLVRYASERTGAAVTGARANTHVTAMCVVARSLQCGVVIKCGVTIKALWGLLGQLTYQMTSPIFYDIMHNWSAECSRDNDVTRCRAFS